MGKVMDRIIEATYEAQPRGPVDLVLPPTAWDALRLEAEAMQSIILNADPQPTTFIGLPVVVDQSIPDNEIHFRHPPSPQHRRGRTDVFKLG